MTSLGFPSTGVTIRPDLKVMPETGSTRIEVVENDSFLTRITVPPLVLCFEVGPWELFSSGTGLASTRRAMIPDSSNIVMLIGFGERLVDGLSLDKGL